MTNFKRILLLGNNGYIGSQLQLEIKRRKIKLFCIDKDIQSGNGIASFNISDKKRLNQVIPTFRPDCVIDCATNSAAYYKKNLIKALKEDFSSTINLLDCLEYFPSTRLIYFSSSYVY